MLLLVSELYSQQQVFYQSIAKEINYIKTNENVDVLFVYIDTESKENAIKLLNAENFHQVATVVDDTLVLLNSSCKDKNNPPITNVCLNTMPKGIDVGKNSNVVIVTQRPLSTSSFFINADDSSSLSFSCISDCVFDSLQINQHKGSNIYFSKLAINKSLYLKTDNSVFKANDSEIKDNIRQKILSHKSQIKIKGYTLNKHH